MKPTKVSTDQCQITNLQHRAESFVSGHNASHFRNSYNGRTHSQWQLLLPWIIVVYVHPDHFTGVLALRRHEVEVGLELVRVRTWRAVSVVPVVLGRRRVSVTRERVGAAFRRRVARALQTPGVSVVSASLASFTAFAALVTLMVPVVVAVRRLSALAWHGLSCQRHRGT